MTRKKPHTVTTIAPDGRETDHEFDHWCAARDFAYGELSMPGGLVFMARLHDDCGEPAMLVDHHTRHRLF